MKSTLTRVKRTPAAGSPPRAEIQGAGGPDAGGIQKTYRTDRIEIGFVEQLVFDTARVIEHGRGLLVCRGEVDRLMEFDQFCLGLVELPVVSVNRPGSLGSHGRHEGAEGLGEIGETGRQGGIVAGGRKAQDQIADVGWKSGILLRNVLASGADCLECTAQAASAARIAARGEHMRGECAGLRASAGAAAAFLFSRSSFVSARDCSSGSSREIKARKDASLPMYALASAAVAFWNSWLKPASMISRFSLTRSSGGIRVRTYAAAATVRLAE